MALGGKASTRTSPMVCPLSPLPGRRTRERLLDRANFCPRIGAKMSQASRKVVDREVAGSDRRRQAVIRLKEDGKGPTEIARELKISRMHVYRVLAMTRVR